MNDETFLEKQARTYCETRQGQTILHALLQLGEVAAAHYGEADNTDYILDELHPLTGQAVRVLYQAAIHQAEDVDEFLEDVARQYERLGWITNLEERRYFSYRYTCAVSWRIKMDSFWWTNGRTYQDGRPITENSPDNDEKWEKWLEDNDQFFWRACESALGFAGDHPEWDLFDGHEDPELSDVRCKFGVAGRSGGWLTLEMWDGYDLTRDPCWYEWDHDDLRRLVKFVKAVDAIVEKREDRMAEEYAEMRYRLEQGDFGWDELLFVWQPEEWEADDEQ